MSGALVLAIDGPAAAGKTVVGRAVAAHLGWEFFDTGVLYRALTWQALQSRVPLNDGQALAELAGTTSIVVNPSSQPDQRPYDVSVNGRDVSIEIRTPAVDRSVSQVSAHDAVRQALVPAQRALARPPGVVMAGRDIGTVIFPDAMVKVYLNASPGVRARRRAVERGVGGAEAATLERELTRRDQEDQTRTTAPLRPAPDAVVVDTDDLTVDEVIQLILELVHRNGTVTSLRPEARACGS